MSSLNNPHQDWIKYHNDLKGTKYCPPSIDKKPWWESLRILIEDKNWMSLLNNHPSRLNKIKHIFSKKMWNSVLCNGDIYYWCEHNCTDLRAEGFFCHCNDGFAISDVDKKSCKGEWNLPKPMINYRVLHHVKNSMVCGTVLHIIWECRMNLFAQYGLLTKEPLGTIMLCPLLLVLLSVSLSLSVYSPPSHMVRHRNFIFGVNMYMCP